MDFFDILLAKKLEDDRDPKVEGLSVTANGTYSEDGVVYKPVVVNVPETPLSSLAVTANGTYTAPTGTGYNEVSVNVPAPENALVIKNYEGVPTNIASFTDGTSNPLKSLTASIVPVQAGSGDPSPSNVRPISGWDEVNVEVRGRNLTNVVSITTQPDTGNIRNTNGTIYTEFVKGKTYTVSFDLIVAQKSSTAEGNRLGLWLNDGGTSLWRPPITAIGHQSFTFTAEADGYANFWCTNAFDAEIKVIDNIQVEEGSVEHDYEPYNGRTYTIPFVDGQGQSVEVFGGSVNVVNGGEQQSTYVKWTVTPTESQITSVNSKRCTVQIPNDKIANSYDINVNKCLCDKLRPSNYSEQYDNHLHFSNATLLSFFLEDEVGTTKQDWVDYFAQAQITVCYKLATPTTFYTQPTSIKSLDGENNVSASTGDAEELKYFTRATS